jgi:hypothetical protein
LSGTNIYAFEAFGQPEDPTFLPLSNLYVPIDLSNQAWTHATLAHAAIHMAHLYGKSSSISALNHKSAAIKLINKSLNDPKTAVSDDTLAAVLRMLTFEVDKTPSLISISLLTLLQSFWGTEDAMRLHQMGLSQLVNQRGGLDTLRGNWRLEMRILLGTFSHLYLVSNADRSNTTYIQTAYVRHCTAFKIHQHVL